LLLPDSCAISTKDPCEPCLHLLFRVVPFRLLFMLDLIQCLLLLVQMHPQCPVIMLLPLGLFLVNLILFVCIFHWETISLENYICILIFWNFMVIEDCWELYLYLNFWKLHGDWGLGRGDNFLPLFQSRFLLLTPLDMFLMRFCLCIHFMFVSLLWVSQLT